jgi:hypothetical protein
MELSLPQLALKNTSHQPVLARAGVDFGVNKATQPRTGALKPSSASLKFGNIGSLSQQTSRLMEPLFRATQEYVWELMLLDVVALWIPRIWNALDRGRVKTSLNQVVMDPKHQEKPSLSQFGTYIKKNIQGLNWPNGIEETWREIQAAPMLLLVQSMLYGIAVEHDVAKRGVLLAKSDLEPMNKAFASYIAEKGPKAEALMKQKGGLHKLTTEFYTNITKAHFSQYGHQAINLKYLRDNIAINDFNWLDSWRINRGKALAPSPRQHTLKWLETEFGRTPGQMTYNNVIERWVKQVTHFTAQNSREAGKLAELETVMKTLLKNYNEMLLPLAPNTPVNSMKLGLPGASFQKTSHVVEVFEKYYDVLRGAGNVTRKATRNVSNAVSLSEHLVKTLGVLERGLLGRKMLYGLGVMGATVVAFFASSMHAQSNNAYPANRLYHHGDGNSNNNTASVLTTGTRLSRTLDSVNQGHKLQHPTGVVS